MRKRIITFILAIATIAGAGLYYYPDKTEALSTTHTLVSLDTSGSVPNGNAYSTSISQDGRYIVYSSNATNVIASDTNNREDVFLYDSTAGTTTLVSKAAGGGVANNQSTQARISPNGKFIVFASSATDIVASDTNNYMDIFLYTVATGTNELISKNSSGTLSNDTSRYPDVSNDGRFVVFESEATNLDSAVYSAHQIFIRDRVLNTSFAVSKTNAGAMGNGSSYQPSISCSGRYVAFASGATNLTGNNNSGNGELILADLAGGTKVFTDMVPGADATATGRQISISCDGNYVAFSSPATNLVAGDTNGKRDAFRYDVQSNSLTRISLNSSGNQVDTDTFDPVLSGDGNLAVFFATDPSMGGTGLVSSDNNTKSDVFLRDIKAGTTQAVSVNSSSQLGNMHSGAPVISASGTQISFTTASDNLYTPTNSGNRSTVVKTATQLTPICEY